MQIQDRFPHDPSAASLMGAMSNRDCDQMPEAAALAGRTCARRLFVHLYLCPAARLALVAGQNDAIAWSLSHLGVYAPQGSFRTAYTLLRVGALSVHEETSRADPGKGRLYG